MRGLEIYQREQRLWRSNKSSFPPLIFPENLGGLRFFQGDHSPGKGADEIAEGDSVEGEIPRVSLLDEVAENEGTCGPSEVTKGIHRPADHAGLSSADHDANAPSGGDPKGTEGSSKGDPYCGAPSVIALGGH